MKRINILLVLLLFIVSGCTNDENGNNIQVLLDYTPNTNHTGLYVALDQGYYEELGLNVTITQPSETSTEALVSSNEAQFGISYSENVAQFNNNTDKSIESIYAILEENTSGFAAYEDKDISTIKDFKGKTYCGWGSDVENALLDVFLSQGGLSIDDIKVTTTTVNFINSPDDCDFMWVYEAWDLVELDNANIDYTYFPLSEYDLDWYTPVIISNDKVSNDVKKNFIEATAKGYEYASKNPQIAADIFLKYNPEYDSDFILDSQMIISDEYSVDGYQDPLIWDDFISILKDNDIVGKELKTEEQYTNDYTSTSTP